MVVFIGLDLEEYAEQARTVVIGGSALKKKKKRQRPHVVWANGYALEDTYGSKTRRRQHCRKVRQPSQEEGHSKPQKKPGT